MGITSSRMHKDQADDFGLPGKLADVLSGSGAGAVKGQPRQVALERDRSQWSQSHISPQHVSDLYVC